MGSVGDGALTLSLLFFCQIWRAPDSANPLSALCHKQCQVSGGFQVTRKNSIDPKHDLTAESLFYLFPDKFPRHGAVESKSAQEMMHSLIYPFDGPPNDGSMEPLIS